VSCATIVTVGKLLGRVILVALAVFGVWYVLARYHDGTTFGCPASGAVAHADSGDCPANIDAADHDAQWAASRWATIKDAKVTTGLYYDRDGTEHTYVSGEDADATHAADVLRQVGAAGSPIGTYPAATHVEIKAAVDMRDAGESQGVIVINNAGGPCPGDMGCAAAVPRVLPRGAALVVWWRSSSGAMQSRRFPGGAG
jgi:hypothetical protein